MKNKPIPEEALKGLISALKDIKEGKYEIISKESESK